MKPMQILLMALLVTACVSGAHHAGAEDAPRKNDAWRRAWPDFVRKVRGHEVELRQLTASSHLVKELKDLEQELNRFLNGIDIEQNPKAVRSAMVCLEEASVNFEPGPPSIYIKHDVVIDVIVNALALPDREVQDCSLNLLLTVAKPAQLKRRASDILAAAPGIIDCNKMTLIGLLDTDESKAYLLEAIRTGAPVSDAHKARLGDVAAEQRLIQKFKDETGVTDVKKHLALALGYVGTRDAVCALAREMRSPLAKRGEYGAHSLRFLLLKGLRRKYPDEPLFNEELDAAVRATRYTEGDQAEAASGGYFDRVERWCEDNCGVKWDGPRPPFLLDKLIAVPHPR